MATRRRTAARKPRTRRRSGPSLPSFALPAISPDLARSLLGLALLVLGAVTLIALILPGQGTLTNWWNGAVGPWFGSLRWMLPFLLIGGGWYLEWGGGQRPGSGWGATLVGIALTFVAFLGMVEVLSLHLFARPISGGGLGRFMAARFVPLLSGPGAFIVLLALAALGLLVGFNLRPRDLTRPVVALARWLGATTAASVQRLDAPPAARERPRADVAASAAADPGVLDARSGVRPRGRTVPGSVAAVAGQTGIWGESSDAAIPVANQTQALTSSTFAPARTEGSVATGAGQPARPAPALPPLRDPDDITDGSDSPPTRERREYVLPPHELLDKMIEPASPVADDAIHRRNEEIIVKKLGSFDIPAQIVGRNAGPVVTQYEVQPAAHVKVSRIEGLADDLAMALAARSLRIEAPIPGKSAVGIEIPNKDFNVVTLRGILESLDFAASGTRLTFALGRDVAGRAQAVDLAKMPHLLIAGATGSGKSVMVNALITSLLCNATPDEVRMILMDLKRVELAAYNGLPHLLVPVITEPERARAALKWTVNEMEARYRRFAGATSRNIKAYNESRADPTDRMPYIIVIIDELADLMMREGKNVEDNIVRLAQKARATGIHLVLATQRPSVNVVTGLIKANFPSRIAFAMASQIDSRTILDTPGAEDLIGRGDMLYQPSDLPRPMRLQGVFVSDPEIARVVQHWKDQIDDPHYDLAIIETGDEASDTPEQIVDPDADRLLLDAVEVIREYDRASASLLQRRLKIGYARAARIIDQLEARGYIGAFDGSNARPVLRRDAGGGGGANLDED